MPNLKNLNIRSYSSKYVAGVLPTNSMIFSISFRLSFISLSQMIKQENPYFAYLEILSSSRIGF